MNIMHTGQTKIQGRCFVDSETLLPLFQETSYFVTHRHKRRLPVITGMFIVENNKNIKTQEYASLEHMQAPSWDMIFHDQPVAVSVPQPSI